MERHRPEVLGKVLAGLAEGKTYGRIKNELGIDWGTVARVAKDYEGEQLDRWKEIAAKKMQHGAEMALQRVYEDLEDDTKMGKTSFKDKTIGLAILKDKEILLRGEATSITERREGVDVEAAKAAIEAARKKISGEVVDV